MANYHFIGEKKMYFSTQIFPEIFCRSCKKTVSIILAKNPFVPAVSSRAELPIDLWGFLVADHKYQDDPRVLVWPRQKNNKNALFTDKIRGPIFGAGSGAEGRSGEAGKDAIWSRSAPIVSRRDLSRGLRCKRDTCTSFACRWDKPKLTPSSRSGPLFYTGQMAIFPELDSFETEPLIY